MCRFYSRNNSFEFTQLQPRGHSIFISNGNEFSATCSKQIRMHGTYSGIIESGGDGIGFGDLPVLGLH